jgi:hypothetical protein
VVHLGDVAPPGLRYSVRKLMALTSAFLTGVAIPVDGGEHLV